MRKASELGRFRMVSALMSFAMTVPAARAGVNVWTTNGPGNLATRRVVADARVPGALYVGTASGVARSTDGGRSWSQTALLSGDPLVASEGVVYASIATAAGPPVPGGFTNVVYKSPDGGAHWQALFSTSTSTSAIWIDPVIPSTLYRADTSAVVLPQHQLHPLGFFRCDDGGLSWTRIDSGLGSNPITAFAVDPGSGALYLATFGLFDPPGIFKSADRGSTWTLLSTGISASVIVIDPNSPSTVYAAGSGVFVSTDGGESFRALNGPGGYVEALIIDRQSSARLYAATTTGPPGVFGSGDGGTSWWPMSQGLDSPVPYVGDLAMDAAGDVLYASLLQDVWHFELDPGSLVLDAAHPFTVALSAIDQRTGRHGAGLASKVNDLWGYFSIPAITGNPDNPEVFVKMLDGTSLNGTYWFFYGGLTDLEYTLTVTEDATGKQKTYTKPAGSECGGSDTAAFAP